jgi:hypothetical protein
MDIFYGILLSTHLGFTNSYNAIHPHAGVYLNEANNISIGAYYNSTENISTYAAYRYDFSDNINAEFGLVTGYPMAPIQPMIKVNYKQFFIAPAGEKIGEEINTGIVLGLEWRN